MYILRIELKQHTPLIHFQHHQDGATLRASEVKPRLDRFMIDTYELTEFKLKDGKQVEVPKETFKKWFINEGKQHLALDYKIRIEPIGNPEFQNLIEMEVAYNEDKKKDEFVKGKDGSFPTFFGNLMKIDEFKVGKPYKKVSFYDKISINFTFKNLALKNKIEKSTDDFFLNNNFGTRQSKGFGSFSLINSNYYIANNYYLSIDTNKTDFKTVFNSISYYHQRLKSGVNYSFEKKDKRTLQVIDKFCHYEKAFLWKFIDNRKLGYNWDKKWLKEEFFPLPNDNKNKKFVRAILGLSYDFKFKKINNPCNPNGILPNRIIEISIDKEEKELQRIKSPITYKPIKFENEWRIYILIQNKDLIKYYEKIKSHDFKFINGSTEKTIQTPENLIDLNELIKEYNEIELNKSYESYFFNGVMTPVKIFKTT